MKRERLLILSIVVVVVIAFSGIVGAQTNKITVWCWDPALIYCHGNSKRNLSRYQSRCRNCYRRSCVGGPSNPIECFLCSRTDFHAARYNIDAG